ncbi:MAG: ABC transporter permease [Chloroflexi bacterium]|nr:ABC transporter permease [Chloroflexota bacterium]
MAFRLIVRKTFMDLSGWKKTLLVLVIGLGVSVVLSLSWRGTVQHAGYSPEMQKYYLLSEFAGRCFVWVAGLFLAGMIAFNAAGAVSRETNEGTMLTLVSKPVRRRDIVLAKFVAIALHALLIEAIVLLLFVLVLWFTLPVEPSILLSLLAAVPWILLYSLLVIVVSTAVSIMFSTLLGSQIAITAVVAVGTLFFFLFGAALYVTGQFSTATYEARHIYLVDGAYNLGNAFAPALVHVVGGQMLPASQLSFLGGFSGIFVGGRENAFNSGYYSGSGVTCLYPAELANYLHPALSIFLLLVLAGGALFIALKVMERKDLG